MDRAAARIRPRGATDLRTRAVSAIQRGPAGVAPAVALTVLIASAAAVLILTEAAAEGAQPLLNRWVRGVAAGVCALAGVAFLIVTLRSNRPHRQAGPLESSEAAPATIALVAAAVLAVLALVPVWLLAARTHPPTEEWIGFRFFDKRWLLAAFVLGTLGAMLVLTAVAQVVRSARAGPGSWSEWARETIGLGQDPVPGPTEAGIGWRRVLLLVGGAFALATYFFGPPWHVALSEVNLHEAPMLGGVQAIANGAIPYIDQAAVQYGPGSELIHYFYLEAVGSFDLEAFRQSNVLLYWLGATVFFATIALRLPAKLALVTCLVSVLVFPTLQMIGFQPDGAVDNQIEDTMHGTWGWPNAMRYVGVFAVAMAFPAVAARPSRRSVLFSGGALGLLWGLTCFVSQENLAGGAIAAATLAALLALTRTAPPRRLLDAIVGVALGFAAVAAPVFAYYAAQGELLQFIELYQLIPSAVAAGYSNTLYFDAGGWSRLYYGLPFLLGALCVLAVIKLRPLRVARSWERERVLLVSALVATCASYFGALTRADPPHLINVTLALPVVVVLAAAYLPRLLGIESLRSARLATAALIAVPLALLPLYQLTQAGQRLSAPLARFSYQSPALEWQRAAPDSVAATRLGSDILARPAQWCCSYVRDPITMREFAILLNRLHGVIGGRRTYVANFIDELYPGAAYFLADLRPAPILFEPITMLMNESLLDEFLTYFQEHISEVEAVVAVHPELPELEMFRRANPDHRETRIRYPHGEITVLTS